MNRTKTTLDRNTGSKEVIAIPVGEDSRCSVRGMIPEDIDCIIEIERACFVQPWSAQMLRAAVSSHGYTGLIAECEPGTVAGYCLYGVVLDEAEIHRIATVPHRRRRGVAGTLLDHVLQGAREQGVRRLLLEVRRDNTAAIALYRAKGFSQDTFRKKYYPDGEDALLMSRELPAK